MGESEKDTERKRYRGGRKIEKVTGSREGKIERNTEVRERETEKERKRSRFVKIKNINKQNLLYGCF